MVMGIIGSRLQNPFRDDPAGTEPSLLVQEEKLVRAVDEVNELQEESSYNSSTRSEQSSAAARPCSSW
jgi:hypothetical protein